MLKYTEYPQCSFYFQLTQLTEGTVLLHLPKKLNLKIYNKVDIEFAIPFTINQMGGGSFTIEVRVPDIDQKYEVLKELNVEIVKEPTTQLWGRRSVWFRDQENNIINFYAPAPKIIK